MGDLAWGGGREKRHTVDFLARVAVAIFGVERLLPTELVVDFPTMAASFIPRVEVGIVFVDPIWRTEFPLIQFAF